MPWCRRGRLMSARCACCGRHHPAAAAGRDPAAGQSRWGLSWGYPGSGPGSLALLISRLLDDINAPGADNATGAPAGLEKLTQTKWPRGTVLTRAQREVARSGRPPAEEESSQRGQASVKMS
jgi:hypothetical protein